MNEPGLVTISMNELRRVKVIESVVEGRLSGVRAAEQLGLSERQVSRLKRRFEVSGAAGLVSGRRGKPGNRQFSMSLRARVIAIIRERYADFRPALACKPPHEHTTTSPRPRRLRTTIKQRAPLRPPHRLPVHAISTTPPPTPA
ncbi:helix-turn-helix domain-containing protein [Paraburkholderia sp. Tr-20389]|uniref:helix-turn-helix domain-containing protein n=1 Tax=Paraburkholderia sp. Tr-20389 TaxID=2703903 RepID=UPI001F12175B|nr:helix-turn-helix domain-containing protein [Paraburkholderia sp. Tr-20389]